MHLNDLWFDVAIRGERDIQDDLIVRLQLTDGTESGSDEAEPDDRSPALGGLQLAHAVDLF
jgi:hypothetical protein